MELNELKVRLKIPESDTSQDASLKIDLEDAIDYVKTHCNNSFPGGFPSSVKRGIVLVVKSMRENSNVSSQSLGDMSKSFFEGATMKEAHKYLVHYRRARIR